MKIIFKKGVYQTKASVEFIQQLMKHGWAYNKGTNTWRTSQARRVIPFYEYCAPVAKKRVGELIKQKRKEIMPSMAEELDLEFEVPHREGLDYKPFQYAGIHFMSARNATLLGDPPGLGKTIQAIGLANLDKPKTVLIICPASLKGMWHKTWNTWSVQGLEAGIAYGDDFPDTPVVIINYEIVDRHRARIDAIEWDHLYIDEAHYLGNPEAGRTKAIYGLTDRFSSWMKRQKNPGIKAKRSIVMTGTPVRTCPHNLWPFLARFDPDDLGKNYWAFIRRYCDWSSGDTLPPKGGSNLDELQEKLRKKLMLRRDKKSVLKELPEKTHQIVELPSKGLKTLIKNETLAIQKALGDLEALIDAHSTDVWNPDEPGDEDDYKSVVGVFRELDGKTWEEQAGKLQEGTPTPFQEMAAARKELALAKLPMCIEFIENVIAGADDKVLVFCFHKDVARALADHFKNCLVITGDTPVPKRQGIVDLFQEHPAYNPFIGNITAAGTGHTLTAASNVIFVELSWVPSDLEQAEDRAWRIGQINAVNIWHLVVEGSMDAKMVEKLVERQQMISETVDRPEKDYLAMAVD